MEYWDQIQEAVAFIKTKLNVEAKTGIILGTGLGNLVGDIEIEVAIDYTDIPHFPVSTVESHKGRLIFGTINGYKVIVMQGRFHYYEGYNMKQVTFPVRVMKLLGIEVLFVSNISGSIQEHINAGDLLIIKDHIDLQKENPLRGANLDQMGPRFPDMSKPYSERLRAKAESIAKANGYTVHQGVYSSVPGPNLETIAEYVYLHKIGADCVGMSTVPEVIVGVHCGLEIFAISVITDKNYPPEEVKEVTVQEVIAVALEAEPKMTTVIKELLNHVNA